MAAPDRDARIGEAWAAMKGATWAIIGRIRDSVPEGGATKGHMGFLHAIEERGGRVTPGELAAALDVTPATVTGALTGMEAAGLVERRPDPDDRRVVHVSITVKGRQVRAAWHETIRGHLREVLAPLDDADLDIIARMLGRVAPPQYGPPKDMVLGFRHGEGQDADRPPSKRPQ